MSLEVLQEIDIDDQAFLILTAELKIALERNGIANEQVTCDIMPDSKVLKITFVNLDENIAPSEKYKICQACTQSVKRLTKFASRLMKSSEEEQNMEVFTFPKDRMDAVNLALDLHADDILEKGGHITTSTFVPLDEGKAYFKVKFSPSNDKDENEILHKTLRKLKATPEKGSEIQR